MSKPRKPEMIGARPHNAGGMLRPKKQHHCRLSDTNAAVDAAYDAWTRSKGRTHLVRDAAIPRMPLR